MHFTKKLLVLALPALFVLGFLAQPAAARVAGAERVVYTAESAEEAAEVEAARTMFGNDGLAALGKALGLGLILIGAGRGIGMIGSHTVDATARQPEAAGNIFQSSIILAALIEGAALFAIVVVAFFA